MQAWKTEPEQKTAGGQTGKRKEGAPLRAGGRAAACRVRYVADVFVQMVGCGGWMGRTLGRNNHPQATTTTTRHNETNPNTFYRAINPCKQSTNVHRIHNWAATLMSRPQQDEFLPFRAREKWMETGCAARPFFQQPRYSGMGEQLPSLPSALPLVGSLSRQACGSCAPLVL